MVSALSIYSLVYSLVGSLDNNKKYLILYFSKTFRHCPSLDASSQTKTHCGVHGKTFRWISSWLTNRTQRVIVDGDASHKIQLYKQNTTTYVFTRNKGESIHPPCHASARIFLSRMGPIRKYQINQVKKIQRSAAHFVLHNYSRESRVNSVLFTRNCPTLQNKRKFLPGH